jgi:hypothetical protein
MLISTVSILQVLILEILFLFFLSIKPLPTITLRIAAAQKLVLQHMTGTLPSMMVETSPTELEFPPR